MSHNLTQTEEFSHIAYSNWKTPWHKLGESWDENNTPSVSEAFKIARLDYKIQKLPYHVDLPDGAGRVNSKDYALVREPIPAEPEKNFKGDPEHRILGTVSEGYEPIDNMKIAEILEHLAKYLKLDVVGSIRNYTTLFVTFRADEMAVLVNGKSDLVRMFLAFVEDKKPGNSMRFLLSGHRVVCENTVDAAEREAKVNISIGHNAGATDIMKWTTETLAGIASKQTALRSAMQMMADRKINDAEAKGVWDAAFPLPAKPMIMRLSEMELSKYPQAILTEKREQWEYHCERMASFFRAAQSAYQGQTDTQNGIEGTAWGALNAATWVTSHKDIGRNKMSVNSRSESVLFGERHSMNVRAWEKAMNLVAQPV